MADELWRMSAVDLAAGIRGRAFTAEEVMVSSLGRLAETNDATNAFVETSPDALEAARRADAALAAGDPVGPLHGVPVAFKINSSQVGYETTHGVAAYAGALDTENDPQVQSLLSAGGISIGRTNCPPWSTRWTTESDRYGISRNPWDPAVTPGGSSGAAAAAVATGVCTIAQGNDIGGSIRYPAANCGVVGIRPTPGRVPGWYGKPADGVSIGTREFLVHGPITRTIADLRLALRAMEAPDPRDPISLPVRDPEAAPRRVALVTSAGTAGIAAANTPEVDAGLRQAGEWLREAGYQVDEVELPVLGEIATLWWKIALTEVRVSGGEAEVHRAGEPGIRRFFELMYQVYSDEFGEVDFAAFLAAYARRGALRREFAEFMEDYPIVVLPNSGEPPFPIGDDVVSVERTREIMTHQWPNMAVPVLGLPALGIPVLQQGGAPVGVQIMARAFDEESTFLAGEAIESRSGIVTPIEPR